MDNTFAADIKQMLTDWNAATPAQRETVSRNASILAGEKELVMRQNAAPHLRGIVAQQNANSIERLYDTLNALHIARGEAAA
jgi:hypothetical protein